DRNGNGFEHLPSAFEAARLQPPLELQIRPDQDQLRDPLEEMKRSELRTQSLCEPSDRVLKPVSHLHSPMSIRSWGGPRVASFPPDFARHHGVARARSTGARRIFA